MATIQPTSRPNNGANECGNGNEANSRFRVYKNCRTTRPSWSSALPSVFRLLPGAHPELPGKLDAFMLEDGSFGNWLFVVPQANFAFGKNGTSFPLQYGPEDSNWRSDSPYCVLYDAIKDYAKLPDAPRSVIDMVEAKNKDLRILPAPTKIIIVAAIPYFRDGKDLSVEGKDYVELLTMSEATFMALSKYLRSKWLSGDRLDPVDPYGGVFFSMWNKESPSPEGIEEQYKITLKGTFGYDLALTPTFPRIGSTYDGLSAQLTQSQLSDYMTIVRPIHEYINYMSYEKQAEIICHHAEAGDIPAWTVTYAFEKYPEWISKGVRMKAQPRRDAPVQGYAPAVNDNRVQQPQYTAYPQAPAQYAQPTQQAPYTPPAPQAQMPYVPPTPPSQTLYASSAPSAAPVQYAQSPATEATGTAYTGNLPIELGVAPASKPVRNSYGADLQRQITQAAEAGMAEEISNDEIPF